MKHFLFALLLLLPVSLFAEVTIDKENCTITKDGKAFPLYGEVYITKFDYEADLKVYITKIESLADLKVYITKFDYEADLKVHLVSSGSWAGIR